MEIAELLSSYGFPIAVSFYLLIRVETSVKELSNTLNQLILELHSLKQDKERE